MSAWTANADLHDEIRGSGSFAATVRNLETVLTLRYEVEVTHTITNRNLPHFDDFLEFCRETGIRQLNLHRMSLQGNALDNRHLAVSPSQWVEFRNRLEGLMARNLDAGGIRVRYPFLFATRSQFEELVRAGKYHHHSRGSFYGDGDRLVVYPDGHLYISSEAFGTESFVGDISTGCLRWNDRSSNELKIFQDENAGIPLINALQSGDDRFPFVLSVSYKRGGVL